MKVTVVHIDGLLVETTDAIGRQDPLTHGIAFVKRMVGDTTSSTLYTANYGEREGLRSWLHSVGLIPSWVEVYTGSPSEVIERTLSFIGGHLATIDLFVSAGAYEAAQMAAEGIPSVRFWHPLKLRDWGPEPGSTWEKRLVEIGGQGDDE